ncbi:MAG: hypothetical protein AAF762_12885 [Pseudomonadota bacterium]
MITVITRLYGDAKSARGVRERLYREGFPRHSMSLISADTDEKQADIQRKLEGALVPEEVSQAYVSRVLEGASLVVVRATYKPLNAVRIAEETFATSGALPTNLPVEKFRIRPPADRAPRVNKEHPRFFTRPPGSDHLGGPLADQFGFRTLSAQQRRDSVMRKPRRIFGEGIMRTRSGTSVISGRFFLSKYFWPAPLLSSDERKRSVIEGGGNPLSRLLGWSTLS